MKEHTSKSLIAAIRDDERWHFRRLATLSRLQWATTIGVVVAGFLTTFAGTAPAKDTFMAYPESLLVVGLVAAVGAAINQGVNFTHRIARHRAAALGHKLIAEGLRHGTLPLERAKALRARVFTNPEVALEVLSAAGE